MITTTPAPAPLDTRDLPPLSAETLEHMHWLVIDPLAVAVLTKPDLARLLDDRKQLIAALRELAGPRRNWPDTRERAERLLIRVEG